MSLRPDSVYRVDLAERPSSPAADKSRDDGQSPPKVLQIRLTDQALRQLASAYTASGSGKPQIRLNFDVTEPELVVGSVSIPLHASLPATASQSRPSANGPNASSSSAAPHELYRLSHDESTLTRVGTIAAKLSVKPNHDISAVAQRLKQQKEEEELRKEQRRQALIQGSSPNLSASSSTSRSSANKTLAAARASSSSASFSSSPLSRSSSLTNVTAQRRQPGLLPPAAVSRVQSREVSPGPRASLPATTHAKVQGASYEAAPSISRTERAITDSPQTSSVAQMRTSSAAHSSGHRSSGTLGSNLSTQDDGHVSDDGQPRRADLTSSPASVGSDLAGGPAKKTTKLTTRQRLAKATKAGSRLLAMSDRKPTPELRAAPSAITSIRASASITSSTQPPAQSSRTAPIDSTPSAATESESLQRASKPREHSVNAPASTTKLGHQGGFKTERDPSTPAQEKSSTHTSSRGRGEATDKAATGMKRTALQESAKEPPKREGTASIEQSSLSFKTDRQSATSSTGKAGAASSKSPEKVARPAVSVVTMRRARPSAVDDAKASPKAASQSGSAAKAAAPAVAPERSEREQRPRARSDSRSHSEIDSRAGPSSSPPSTLANAKKRVDEQSDSSQRKRRRTNDFASPSDQSTRYRERRLSASPGPTSRRADSDALRRRDESATRSNRFTEASTGEASVREHLPPSASMPSFASVGNRLRSVPETGDRDSRNARDVKVDDYRDRRHDRRSDEHHRDADAVRDRGKSYYHEADEGSRGRSGATNAQGSSSRGPSTGSNAVKSPSDAGERSIKGVGPGAAHWSEPWLDVRSRADWHRLAERFAKTQQEYLASRKRLDAESERLDRELELASAEEQAASQPTGLHPQAPASQSLLFSPHAHSVSKMTGHPSTSGDDELDVDMLDVEKETSLNTERNATHLRRRPSSGSRRREPREDGEESPEEGEMRSSDDEAQPLPMESTKASVKVEGHPRAAGAELQTLLRDASRSESPDNIAWRVQPSGLAAGADTSTAGDKARSHAGADTDRPLSYADLAERVQQLAELHGSLSRMHRVLVDFKAKGLAGSLT